jgi:hypothetical protein
MRATGEPKRKAGSRGVPSKCEDRENHDGPDPSATSCLPASPRPRVRAEHNATFRIIVLGTIPSTLVNRISSLHATSIMQANHAAAGRAAVPLENVHQPDDEQGETLHPNRGGKHAEKEQPENK